MKDLASGLRSRIWNPDCDLGLRLRIATGDPAPCGLRRSLVELRSRCPRSHSGFQILNQPLTRLSSLDIFQILPWTGGRVAEGTGLENRRTGNGTVSSNLTLSAR